jgi:hypothetical protein
MHQAMPDTTPGATESGLSETEQGIFAELQAAVLTAVSRSTAAGEHATTPSARPRLDAGAAMPARQVMARYQVGRSAATRVLKAACTSGWLVPGSGRGGSAQVPGAHVGTPFDWLPDMLREGVGTGELIEGADLVDRAIDVGADEVLANRAAHTLRQHDLAAISSRRYVVAPGATELIHSQDRVVEWVTRAIASGMLVPGAISIDEIDDRYDPPSGEIPKVVRAWALQVLRRRHLLGGYGLVIPENAPRIAALIELDLASIRTAAVRRS